VRLYVVPGMDHCAGGEGAYVVDWLTVLEEWAGQGKAPAALHASHPSVMPGPPGAPPAPAAKAFTRLLCPHPEFARYNGGGDDTDAANFTCVTP
jgi:feruloyl esterase